MIALAFFAIAGGVILMVAGVTGSTIASAAKGTPDHAKVVDVSAGSEPAAASPTGSAGKAGSGPAGQVAWDYLTKQGLTPAQAAGVIGNLQQESGLDPHAPGGGLAQWIGGRWDELVRFASRQGADPNSAPLQVEYLWHELTTSERGALLALKRATTPRQAARVFSEQYERPGEPMLGNRERYADEALARYGGGK